MTGDSLAQDQETGRGTGDPRTERRKRTVILRESQESSPRILQLKKSPKMAVKMDPTRVWRMERRIKAPQVLKPRRMIRRSLSQKRSLISKRKMEWLLRGIIDLTRETLLILKMRTRRMTEDLAPETGDALGTGGHDQGAAEVEGGLALGTGGGAEAGAEIGEGRGAGAETGGGRGAGREWRGSVKGRGGSGNTGDGKRGSRGREKTGGGGSARERGKKKR